MASFRDFEHESQQAGNMMSPGRWEHDSRRVGNLTSPRKWEYESGRAEHMTIPEHDSREQRGEIPVRLDHYPPHLNVPRPMPSAQRGHIPNPPPAPMIAPIPTPEPKPIPKSLPSPLRFYSPMAHPPRIPPRNFSRIDEEVGISSPYLADDDEALRNLTGPSVNTIMQNKRASRSREWMKTLQSQENVKRTRRRRRRPTPWMKWMNSEWKNRK